MKKNRHLLIKSLIMLIMAAFTFTTAYAQEKKEEKKVIKIKMMADDDGNITLDTTIVLDEDFDGDWKTLIDDEELLKELEHLEIDLDLDGEANIYMLKAPSTAEKGYFYTVDTDDEGEVTIEINSESAGTKNVWVSKIDGDSTITVVMKSSDCKHEGHAGEHKMVMSKSMNVKLETEDGDSVITYTIKVDGEDGEEDVMIWTSDGSEPLSHEVLMEKMAGDSCKVIIMSTGDDGKSTGVVKKEVIIITDKEGIHEHDHEKDKDKKKKKK